jgi:hypothetical protein
VSDYRIGTSATLTAGTGTITVPTSTTHLVGTATAFLTELAIGDLVLASNGQIMCIASISSNVAAEVVLVPPAPPAAASFQINKLVSIPAINADAIDPLGSFYRWMLTVPTGDALERALGRPHVTWYWKNIGVNLRTALLAYCPSKSARVYIRTQVDPNLGTYGTYLAAMLWPDTDQAYTPDFSLEFRDLVLI